MTSETTLHRSEDGWFGDVMPIHVPAQAHRHGAQMKVSAPCETARVQAFETCSRTGCVRSRPPAGSFTAALHQSEAGLVLLNDPATYRSHGLRLGGLC
jgi:hypothetical protein